MIDLPLGFYIWFWRAWLLAFVAVETLAVLDSTKGDTLTESLRPLFHHHPLTWLLTAGFVAWLALHFLFPGLEQWLAETSEHWRQP